MPVPPDVKPTRVAVLCDGDADAFGEGLGRTASASARRRAEGILAAWPGPVRPHADFVSVSEERSLGEITRQLRNHDAILALPGHGAARAMLYRLTAIMHDCDAGALAVVASAAAFATPESGHALVLLDASREDASLAAALYALACLRPTFAARREELVFEQQIRAAAARQLEEHHSELQMAVLLQREFLPKTFPAMAGVEFASLFRPGSSVSGDLYDAVRLDEHHVGFLLADAAGHGVPAALMMMMTSRLLPMKEIGPAGYRVVPPGEALTRLNNLFLDRRGETNALISAVYGVIDTRDGSVRVASAGHPPAVLLGGQGLKLVSAGGPLIGVMEGFEYAEAQARLAPGESLLVHSDGFEHAFGLEHSAEQLAAAISEPFRGENALAGAVAALTRTLDSRDGSLHPPDDVSLLAIRRTRDAKEGRKAA